jgi:hypothetical protein
MKLPIDTNGMTFLAAGAAEPVVDFDSKTAKVDENGEPIYAVQVVVLAGGGADVISVKVAGEPKGMGQAVPLKVTGLVASPWTMGDRSGVAFRAAKVEPATPVRSAA